MSTSTASPEDTGDKAGGVAAKRETLTSRAKRIIGRALEAPKENGAPGGFMFHRGYSGLVLS
jgi:hypothetical protein